MNCNNTPKCEKPCGDCTEAWPVPAGSEPAVQGPSPAEGDAPLDPANAPGIEKIWSCKIGGRCAGIPSGSDGPMRAAARLAFIELTGYEPEFIFSGWGAELTEGERAVHENREPAQPQPKHTAVKVEHNEFSAARKQWRATIWTDEAMPVGTQLYTAQAPAPAPEVHRDGWNEPYNCIAAGPTATDVALWRAMNEAEKYGLRTDDKLIRKALNDAGYYLVRSMKKPGTCEHMLAGPDVQAPAVKDGFALVPVNPTPEMLRAACEAIRWYEREVTARAVYAAMLTAAPNVPVQGSES